MQRVYYPEYNCEDAAPQLSSRLFFLRASDSPPASNPRKEVTDFCIFKKKDIGGSWVVGRVEE